MYTAHYSPRQSSLNYEINEYMELPLSKFSPSISSFKSPWNCHYPSFPPQYRVLRVHGTTIIQVSPLNYEFYCHYPSFPLNYEFYCHYPSFSPQLRVLLPLSKFFPSITSFTAIIQVFPLNYEFYCHYPSFSPQLRVLLPLSKFFPSVASFKSPCDPHCRAF